MKKECMKKLRILLAAVVIALTSVTAFASPASAHHFDGTSHSTCYQAMLPGYTNVAHSHLNEVGENWAYVDYYCCMQNAATHRYYYATRWWNLYVTGHDYGPTYLDYCP